MNDTIAVLYGYARAAWRRRWWAVGTAWGVALLAWALVLLMPDRYEASARVFVDARTALRPVLEGIAIEEDYESQVSLVREALLSRPQLEAVARKTKLDAKVTTPAQLDALVTGLQKEIHVVSASAATSSEGAVRDTIYTISYEHPVREKSVEVVRTLLDNFEEGTLSGNRSGATAAQEFLNLQIAELEKRLQAAEGRLAEFKKRNIGMIPGEEGDYFTRLNQEMSGLQQAETNLAVALSRRAELQRQLANSRVYLSGTGSGGGGAGGGGAVDITLRRQEAEQRLEELLLRYTDRHPEVIAIRGTITELKDRETKELAELQRGGEGTGAIRSLSVNPVYQQVQSQLNQVQVEIASFQGAAAQHRREIANLKQFVNQAPEIEQEFSRLNRDYGVTKEQYDQLVARREQARVSDDAARTGIVRFDTIEPPRAAIEPVSPKRELLFIAALFLALGAGFCIAIVPYLLSPTFGDVASLQRKLGLPVLGTVSVLHLPGARENEKRDMRTVAFAAAALLVVCGALVAFGSAGANMIHELMA